MTENKIFKLEFSARSQAAGKLTEQQSECLPICERSSPPISSLRYVFVTNLFLFTVAGAATSARLRPFL
jgi:hypothetical protein